MIARDTLLRVRKPPASTRVAAGYLTLRRSGKDLVALCPFHDERHLVPGSARRSISESASAAARPWTHTPHAPHGGCGFEEAVRLLAASMASRWRRNRGTGRGRTARGTTGDLRAAARPSPLLLPDPAGGITGEDENGEEDLRALREAFSTSG